MILSNVLLDKDTFKCINWLKSKSRYFQMINEFNVDTFKREFWFQAGTCHCSLFTVHCLMVTSHYRSWATGHLSVVTGSFSHFFNGSCQVMDHCFIELKTGLRLLFVIKIKIIQR